MTVFVVLRQQSSRPRVGHLCQGVGRAGFDRRGRDGLEDRGHRRQRQSRR